MCQQGVKAFVQKLSGQDIGNLEHRRWEGVRDGFGPRDSSVVELSVEICPRCNKSFPIVRRVLESCAYNLPDVAVYQRFRFRSPGVALGLVVKGRTTNPDKYRPGKAMRGRWQGLMWSVYQVAFLDVVEGVVGEFCPAKDWAIGDPPANLDQIAQDARHALCVARRQRSIPVGTDSTATEDEVGDVLAPVFDKCGYKALKKKSLPAFWWGPGHQLDLVYGDETEQSRIAIEVKVTEDWDHPICEPLGDLMGHNAVLNIRVPPDQDELDKETRELVTKAESMLEATGRARFIYVWPECG